MAAAAAERLTLTDRGDKRELRNARGKLVTDITYINRKGKRVPISIEQHVFKYHITIQYRVTEMIFISAVGMINAPGRDNDEIAANLARGIAPGMRPREGWLQGHPQAIFAGWTANYPPFPIPFATIVRAIISCCWRRWRRSGRRWIALSPAMAGIGSPWCWAPVRQGWMKATYTLI